MNFSKEMRFNTKIKKNLAVKCFTLARACGKFFHHLAIRMEKNKPKFLNSILTVEIFFYPSGTRCKCDEKILKISIEIFSKQKIDAILMYNDCRIIHAKAIKVAKELGIEIWILKKDI